MKRTIITLLAILSLSIMAPAAYAQEYIPEVSTLSELQQAIAEAEPGDTIRLLQTIDVDTPVTIGVDGKPLTLCAAAGVQTYLRHTVSCTISALTVTTIFLMTPL